MNLIFLGPPGAGKGTLASRLTKDSKIPQISTGEMLRSHMQKETELGKKAKSFVVQGELVPDEVVIGMVKERLDQEDCQNGYVLDGFPRTVAQAKALDQIARIDRVINLQISDELILQRLRGRRVCPECGGTYHVSMLPEETCPKCEVPLEQRKDDSEETIRNRLAVYQAQTSPLIDYYEQHGKLSSVDVRGTVDENYEHLQQILQEAVK